jgi:deoxyribodipyrimidine photolyase-related protein
MGKTLRLVFGDQLNLQHSWFVTTDADNLYLMMEMKQETDYVKHHIQKVVGFFLAMRNFSDTLQKSGHHVIYWNLDHENNTQNLTENLFSIIHEHQISRFEYQLPDEYRLDIQLEDFCKGLKIPFKSFDSEHFLTERAFLAGFFKGKKTYLMETFYREMRKKYKILMDGQEPLTGKWNYDQENRNKLKDPLLLKDPKVFPKNVSSIVALLKKMEVETIGSIEEDNFNWPISRDESLEVLDYFCEHLLNRFGEYQDAMYSGDEFLFHSRLSFSLNTKMLSPLEVVSHVERYFEAHQDSISIAQVEGFIRQIIGWREYMRGIYWAKMPEFASMNFFGHDRKLPDFFWTGKTNMNCLKHSIGQSLKTSYAHHIQRLMVTGNFALLAGIDPDELDQWYLGIYIDAIEWVEITNTRGMSQFADGGIVGTKPYVSSANYIDKMGDYCQGCRYDKKLKVGKMACPFNSLYWHFYNRNSDKLAKNPRIGMMYRTWEKMKDKSAIMDQAEFYLEHLDEL